MIYGYARCSTNESKQDINRQLRELKAEGADEVYFEYEHGDAKVVCVGDAPCVNISKDVALSKIRGQIKGNA